MRLASHAGVLRGSSRVLAPLTNGSSLRTSDIQTLTCLLYLLVAFTLSIFSFMVSLFQRAQCDVVVQLLSNKSGLR